MKRFVALASALVVACSGLSASAAELKSGLQPGDAPGAFNVQDVTGPSKGKSLCYRCQYGNRPVVSIFARNVDENLTNLIKQVDNVVGKNEDNRLKAFVVLLTDDPDAAEKELARVAKDNKIKNVPLTIFDGLQGPEGYEIANSADVSVMMWVESNVKVSHALPKGELDKAAVKSIVADTTKILN